MGEVKTTDEWIEEEANSPWQFRIPKGVIFPDHGPNWNLRNCITLEVLHSGLFLTERTSRRHLPLLYGKVLCEDYIQGLLNSIPTWNSPVRVYSTETVTQRRIERMILVSAIQQGQEVILFGLTVEEYNDNAAELEKNTAYLQLLEATSLEYPKRTSPSLPEACIIAYCSFWNLICPEDGKIQLWVDPASEVQPNLLFGQAHLNRPEARRYMPRTKLVGWYRDIFQHATLDVCAYTPPIPEFRVQLPNFGPQGTDFGNKVVDYDMSEEKEYCDFASCCEYEPCPKHAPPSQRIQAMITDLSKYVTEECKRISSVISAQSLTCPDLENLGKGLYLHRFNESQHMYGDHEIKVRDIRHTNAITVVQLVALLRRQDFHTNAPGASSLVLKHFETKRFDCKLEHIPAPDQCSCQGLVYVQNSASFSRCCGLPECECAQDHEG